MLARLGADLVHGPSRRHEGGEAARPKPLDRAGDEIVVQRQTHSARVVVGADGAVGERRIADHEVIGLAKLRLGEILVPDLRVRIEEFRDPGRGAVHLDAGHHHLAGERFRREREKETGSTTRSRTWPPSKPILSKARQMARMMNSGVKCAYWVARDRLARSLRATSCSSSSPRSSTWARICPIAAEESVGEVGSAERGEAREPLLLIRASVAALGFNRGQKPDRGEIGCRPALPGLGELAIANEAIVMRGDGRRPRRRRLIGFKFVRPSRGRRLGALRRGKSTVETKLAAEARRVEKGQANCSWLVGVLALIGSLVRLRFPFRRPDCPGRPPRAARRVSAGRDPCAAGRRLAVLLLLLSLSVPGSAL